MNFLVVNDDSYTSLGIEILTKALLKFGNVYVCAPLTEQSACSQRITIGNKLLKYYLKENNYAIKTLAVDGTPADCVKVGLKYFDNIDFDIIFSGINHGPNLSYDTLYSGTVGAIKEASLDSYPAIAFSSIHIKENEIQLFNDVVDLLDLIIRSKLYEKFTLLNINIPPNQNGIRVCKLGTTRYSSNLKKLDDNSYSQDYNNLSTSVDEDNDYYYFHQGYITITPLITDQTDHKELKSLTNSIKKIGEKNDL